MSLCVVAAKQSDWKWGLQRPSCFALHSQHWQSVMGEKRLRNCWMHSGDWWNSKNTIWRNCCTITKTQILVLTVFDKLQPFNLPIKRINFPNSCVSGWDFSLQLSQTALHNWAALLVDVAEKVQLTKQNKKKSVAPWVPQCHTFCCWKCGSSFRKFEWLFH